MGGARLRLRGSRNNHRLSQEGNRRPRLFRYPRQKALVNRMGFNNDGADAVAARLERRRKAGRWPNSDRHQHRKIEIYAPDQAPDDYLYGFRLLSKFGDYFVISNELATRPGCAIFRRPSVCNRSFAFCIGRRPESRCWSRSHRISPTSELFKSPSYARAKESPVCSQPMRRLDHSALPKKATKKAG